jgi:hypothetical protein
MRVAVSLAALVGGGVGISYVPLNKATAPMAPRAAASVEVFTTPPKRAYVEVFSMQSVDRDVNQASDYVISKMREAAGEHGCEGLVLAGSNNQASFVRGTSARPTDGRERTQTPTSQTLKDHRATCIVFTDAPGVSSKQPPSD